MVYLYVNFSQLKYILGVLLLLLILYICAVRVHTNATPMCIRIAYTIRRVMLYDWINSDVGFNELHNAKIIN